MIKRMCLLLVVHCLFVSAPLVWAQDEADEELFFEEDAGESTSSSPAEDDLFFEEESSDVTVQPAEEDSLESELEASEPTPKEEPSSGEQFSEQDLSPEEPLDEEITPEQIVEEPEPPPSSFPTPEPEPLQAQQMAEPSADEPDLAYEARLYDIYVNFQSQKTSAEQWDSLVGGRQSETYQIQPGDNLWSISKTLFGDGNYWPKVWSLNNKITNPHLIQPGYTLRFLLGDESDAPAFTISEQEAPAEAQPPQNGDDSYAADPNQIEIPPPGIVSRPVLKRFPPSLPQWQTQERGDYDDVGIDYDRRPIADLKDNVVLPGYITSQAPKGLGEVAEIETGGDFASVFQYVFVKVKPGAAKVGDEFLTIKNNGPVQPVNKNVGGPFGQSIEVQGKIKLVEMIKGRGSEDYFRAMVLKVINPVSKGAELVSESPQTIELNDQGPRSQVVAQIIGGTVDNVRSVFGPLSITFLNRGKSDGLNVGDILPIRANHKTRNPETEIVESLRPIGYLQIVKTDPYVSTAIVLKAWEDILPGDFTGQGALLSSAGLPPTEAIEDDFASEGETFEEEEGDNSLEFSKAAPGTEEMEFESETPANQDSSAAEEDDFFEDSETE